MSELLSLVAHHGYLIIFLTVFAEAIGLPVPAALALVAGGAAGAAGVLRVPAVLPLAVGGMLLGDSLLYAIGRHWGWRLLGFLCKVSLNPETCILRAAGWFYKRGRATLLIAKFIPGVNALAPLLAGSMKLPLIQFLTLDFAGAGLYALGYGAISFLFRNFLDLSARRFRAKTRNREGLALSGDLLYIAMAWGHCEGHALSQDLCAGRRAACGADDLLAKVCRHR
jgi:membrane protein DedA with SNARE-associated domain